MAGFLGLETGLQAPSFSGIGAGLGTTLNWILILLVICGVMGFISWIVYRKLVYSTNAFFFERINGLRPTLLNTKPIGLRKIKIGMNEGEMLWHKKFGYLPADGFKMGVNTYFFEKNPNTGYWQPFYLRELDQALMAVDIEYVTTDFKGTAYVARKATEQRHQSKKANFDKVLAYGLIGLVVIATLVWSYYTYKQNKDFDAQVTDNQVRMLELQKGISEDFKVAVNKLEQVRADSGVRVAPPG